MINYNKITVENLDDNIIEQIYNDLLKNKWHFAILELKDKLYVLTKEKSLFKIENEHNFITCFQQDVYYRTIINNQNVVVNEVDLNIYKNYIQKYKSVMQKNIYGGKYIFGSVAVKTENGFITTVRGKQDLNDYTIVQSVDHVNHTINVINKKATLNAPLLDYLFKNTNAKIIVHVHEFNENLPYVDYAFPGTVKDSIRNIKTSFNIKHHGFIKLFDINGNLI